MITFDRPFGIRASLLGVFRFQGFQPFSKTLLGTRGSSSNRRTASCYREKFPKDLLNFFILPTGVLYHRSRRQKKNREEPTI
jgi:hypothetical protein